MSLRNEISSAVVDGFGGHARVEHATDRNRVYVDGHDEPIVVLDDDVLVPESLKGAVSGIRLDVQAILASR